MRIAKHASRHKPKAFYASLLALAPHHDVCWNGFYPSLSERIVCAGAARLTQPLLTHITDMMTAYRLPQNTKWGGTWPPSKAVLSRFCRPRNPVGATLAACFLLVIMWATGLLPAMYVAALRAVTTTTTTPQPTEHPPVQLRPYDRWELEKRMRLAIDDALLTRLPQRRDDIAASDAGAKLACMHFTCMSTFRPKSKVFLDNITVTNVSQCAWGCTQARTCVLVALYARVCVCLCLGLATALPMDDMSSETMNDNSFDDDILLPCCSARCVLMSSCYSRCLR